MDWAAIWIAIKPFLPLLAPVIIAGLKNIAPKIINAVPAMWKPVLSAIIAMVISILSGLDGGASIATAATMGFAGSKLRDMAVDKPGACASL